MYMNFWVKTSEEEDEEKIIEAIYVHVNKVVLVYPNIVVISSIIIS